MTERPILFSGPMILSLLAGRKTQTRRILKPQPSGDVIHFGWSAQNDGAYWTDQSFESHRLRIWAGDRLWVRETFMGRDFGDESPSDERRRHYAFYKATSPDAANDGGHWHSYPGRWTPSIHMPRWASRITLDVTDVRVQRLQDISPDDCEAEGIEAFGPDVAVYRDNAATGPEATRRWDAFRVREYRKIWETINGPGSWEANPWVVAYTFIPSGRAALENGG